MKKIRRSLAVGLGLCVLAPLAAPTALSASPTVDPVPLAARDWLVAQQQTDGSFELAGFPGFETPDAIFALAAQTQGAPTWDVAAAAAAIDALQAEGGDPLDAIDDLVDDDPEPTGIAAGARAAKLISLVTAPLGIDATAFDPSNDSEVDVDLVARMNQHRNPDGSYEFGAQFNGVLFAAIALDSIGAEVPAALVAQIKAAQRPDGSWDFTGGADGPGEDIDTTSIALLALRSSGLGLDNGALDAAVRFLASRQQASGAWQSFGADDPNSTSLAIMALSDLRIDVTTVRWRNSYGSPVTGAYVSPLTWLRSQQAADGHIVSPNDPFGVNTFATSQSVQALSRQWFLDAERGGLLDAWGEDLGSPVVAISAANGVEDASPELGPNPSIKSARTNAANAVIYGEAGRRAAAADLFQQALGREIDPSGSDYWSTKLIDISRTEMLARLTGSSEFYRNAGSNTAGFVDAAYLASLGRAADPSGRAFWIRRIDNGASVRSVARAHIASSEFRRIEVQKPYQRMLGRLPNEGEQNYWIAKVATTRVEFLLQTLGASDEYYSMVRS